MRSWRSQTAFRRCLATNSAPKLPELVTLLHKASSLLRSTLREPEPYTSILTRTQLDLTSSEPRPARIGIHDCGNHAPVRDLVSALLLEPFGSATYNDSIRNRWKDQKGSSLRISLQNFDSSFLRRFPLPVEMYEILESSIHHPDSLPFDFSIFVYNPMTSPLDTIPPEAIDHATSCISRPRISIDSSRALEAVESLAVSPRAASDIQHYQDGFIGSGMPRLLHLTEKALGVGQSPQEALLAVRRQTAISQIQFALRLSGKSIQEATNDMKNVSSRMSELRDSVEQKLAELQRDVFGESSSQISTALDQSDIGMRAVLESLSLWKSVRQADELGAIVTKAVENNWCPALEKQVVLPFLFHYFIDSALQLIYHSGRLSVIQESFQKSTFALLEEINLVVPSLSLHVLRNTLEQKVSSRTYQISPETTIQPITARRQQIIQYPTSTLHRTAQNLTLTLFGSFVGGGSIAWVGWIGWLSSIGVEQLGTALGLGALTSLLGLRFVLTRWSKAKQNWWSDWKRIQNGFRRDLQASFTFS
ncbi:hypothetical protein DL96DRAFT_1798351 [Flagelloscypha sp. PMI_526]|nr:hypothetical protein DL96DRAFT_1798351 [Flagelloscypha sp. PMI_526]